jgi:type VI secretion system secreted protein Hcp
MAKDMFFKIGDLKGESQDKKHKDEIDVLSWSWGSL